MRFQNWGLVYQCSPSNLLRIRIFSKKRGVQYCTVLYYSSVATFHSASLSWVYRIGRSMVFYQTNQLCMVDRTRVCSSDQYFSPENEDTAWLWTSVFALINTIIGGIPPTVGLAINVHVPSPNITYPSPYQASTMLTTLNLTSGIFQPLISRQNLCTGI